MLKKITAVSTLSKLLMILTFSMVLVGAEAKTYRLPNDLKQNGENTVFAFKENDHIIMSIEAKGDFLKTSSTQEVAFDVQRDFSLKLSPTDVLLSLDGIHFQKISELARGKMTIGKNLEDESFNFIFEMFLKN